MPMDAARPWLSDVLVVLLVATAVGTMAPHRAKPPDTRVDRQALAHARLALQRSQIVALEAHVLLIDDRIDGVMWDLDAAGLADFQRQLKVVVGPNCRGLACFD